MAKVKSVKQAVQAIAEQLIEVREDVDHFTSTNQKAKRNRAMDKAFTIQETADLMGVLSDVEKRVEEILAERKAEHESKIPAHIAARIVDVKLV